MKIAHLSIVVTSAFVFNYCWDSGCSSECDWEPWLACHYALLHGSCVTFDCFNYHESGEIKLIYLREFPEKF
ncbi:hypothetical protein M758_10G063100 [Ceratodon purpureus]|nr:hypothetical protein M758_10G063100 [Ceratodon purpureus]